MHMLEVLCILPCDQLSSLPAALPYCDTCKAACASKIADLIKSHQKSSHAVVLSSQIFTEYEHRQTVMQNIVPEVRYQIVLRSNTFCPAYTEAR